MLHCERRVKTGIVRKVADMTAVWTFGDVEQRDRMTSQALLEAVSKHVVHGALRSLRGPLLQMPV